jgi:hypothetical protein
MFTLFTRLLRRRPPAPRAVHVGDEEPPLPGCGWFDSSHELRAGLVVTEHASPDAVAQEMALADWLQWHLGAWQPPCGA